MSPGMVPGDDFDLDIRVVAAGGQQPVRATGDTERCTPRYGAGYTCHSCSTNGCKTIMFCGVSNVTCCYWSKRR
jgi:hypothetical protein